MKDIAQALKFVKGAVSGKDYVPEFTHFRIKGGHVMAFNGRLTLSHPIDLDLDVAPKAKFFEKALASVPEDEPVSITFMQSGRLSVKAGKFRVHVQCHMDVPDAMFPPPSGVRYEIDLGLLEIFKDLYPFIAEDASRPWAQTVLLTGQSAFATNNVVLVERWCNVKFAQPISVPVEAVREILRVGIEPCALQVSDRAATFHFPNGAWMRTQFLETDWPDLSPIIAQPLDNLMAVPEGFYDDMRRLETFIEDTGAIHIRGTSMSTTTVDNEGASIDTPEPLGDGSFHIKVLLKIASVATRVDLRNRPAVFTAPGMRGVAMPMSS